MYSNQIIQLKFNCVQIIRNICANNITTVHSCMDNLHKGMAKNWQCCSDIYWQFWKHK